VTGAVGYLYSAASQGFITDYMANPKAGALAIKAAIMKNITAHPSMTDITVSGGILNLFGAAQDVSAYSSAVTPPLAAGTVVQ
jgi:hypothetical protein